MSNAKAKKIEDVTRLISIEATYVRDCNVSLRELHSRRGPGPLGLPDHVTIKRVEAGKKAAQARLKTLRARRAKLEA